MRVKNNSGFQINTNPIGQTLVAITSVLPVLDALIQPQLVNTTFWQKSVDQCSVECFFPSRAVFCPPREKKKKDNLLFSDHDLLRLSSFKS